MHTTETGRGSPRRLGIALALALAGAGAAAWWVLPQPEDVAAGGAVVRREPGSVVEAGDVQAPARLQAPLPTERSVVPLPGATDELLDRARRRSLVLAWWVLPPEKRSAGAPCEVVVVDGADRPVAGATVEVLHGVPTTHVPDTVLGKAMGGRIDGWSGHLVEFVTDDAGRCTIELPLQRADLRAWRAGSGCSGPVHPWKGNADQPRQVLLVLQPELHLEGRVVQTDGSPLARAPVYSYPDQRPLPPRHPQPAFVRETDGEGRFSLDLHVADDYRVDSVVKDADEEDKRSSATESIEELVDAGRELLLVVPTRHVWAGITGTIVGADGSPVPGISLRLWEEGEAHENAWDGGSWRHAQTDFPLMKYLRDQDEDTPLVRTHGLQFITESPFASDDAGRFTSRLAPPVRGWLTSGDGELPLRTPQRVNSSAGVRSKPLALRIDKPATIRGRITDAAGNPLGNAWLWAVARWPDGTDPALRLAVPAQAAFGWAQAPANADGSFELARLHPEGRFDIVYEGYSGATPWRDTVPDVGAGTDGLRIAVGAEQWLAGSLLPVVTSASTGERVPLPRFVLRRRNPDRSTPAIELVRPTDTDGDLRLRGLHAGEVCDLLVQADGLGDVLLRDVVAMKEGTPLAVALPELGALECVVTSHGAPVAWGLVVATNLEREAFGRGSSGRATGRADAAGVARIEGLSPGTWHLVVAQADERVERDVVVPPGGTARERVELP